MESAPHSFLWAVLVKMRSVVPVTHVPPLPMWKNPVPPFGLHSMDHNSIENVLLEKGL